MPTTSEQRSTHQQSQKKHATYKLVSEINTLARLKVEGFAFDSDFAGLCVALDEGMDLPLQLLA